MQMITTIGLDIAKSVFQVHGVDAAGEVVIRRQLKRRYVLVFFQKLSPCLVGMEACALSHYWSRDLEELGHTVRLMPPAYVKPYVKRPHNPAGDNRWFQKNAPAVPRRRYADFCNKICHKRTFPKPSLSLLRATAHRPTSIDHKDRPISIDAQSGLQVWRKDPIRKGISNAVSTFSVLQRRRRYPDRSVGLLMQYPLGGAVEIVVLPACERPNEGRERREADAERDRYQIKVIYHSPASKTAVAGDDSAGCGAILGRPLRRSALATTTIDDPDIATAATSGVTCPVIANGTATTLYAMATATFSPTRWLAFRAGEIARGTADRLSRRNTKSAALRPTSAAEAGAIDGCATASAGAAFSPSPTIRTFRSEASSAATCAAFPPGNMAAQRVPPTSAPLTPTEPSQYP